jgi:hypothetical protein
LAEYLTTAYLKEECMPMDKMMELIQQGQAPENTDIPSPDAAGAGPDSSTPPMASPMSTPEPKMGSKAAANINIQMAMDLLEQSLPALGSESEEGQQIMKSLASLHKMFGKREAKNRELMPAEILQMIQTLPQAGGASPQQRSIAQAPVPGMQQPPLPM